MTSNYSTDSDKENSPSPATAEPLPFFSSDDIKVLLQRLKDNPSKIDRNILLDYVRATAPTNVYKLSKETGFAYTSLKAIIREFEFVGLIYSITKINNNSQAYKEYYIKEEQK